MDFRAGDIVELTVEHTTSNWVVQFQLTTSPSHYRVRQLVNGRAFERIAGAGDLELVLRPTFANGDQVKLDGHTVTIEIDDGDSVLVMLPAHVRREKLRGTTNDHVAFGPGLASVSRGALAAENLRKLLEE